MPEFLIARALQKLGDVFFFTLLKTELLIILILLFCVQKLLMLAGCRATDRSPGEADEYE